MKVASALLVLCTLLCGQQKQAEAASKMVCGGMTVFTLGDPEIVVTGTVKPLPPIPERVELPQPPPPVAYVTRAKAASDCEAMEGATILSANLLLGSRSNARCLEYFLLRRMLSWGGRYTGKATGVWLDEGFVGVDQTGGSYYGSKDQSASYPVVVRMCQKALTESTCGSVSVFLAIPPRLGDGLALGYTYGAADAACNTAVGQLVESELFYDQSSSAGTCLADFVRKIFFSRRSGYSSEAVMFWLHGCPSDDSCSMVTLYKSGTTLEANNYKVGKSHRQDTPAAICQVGEQCSGYWITSVGQEYTYPTGGYDFETAFQICNQLPNSTLPSTDHFYEQSLERRCLTSIVRSRMTRWQKSSVRLWLDSDLGAMLKVDRSGDVTALSSMPLTTTTDVVAVFCQKGFYRP